MKTRPKISIGVAASIHQVLKDLRPRSAGIIFGSIEDVARQYGIKHKEMDGYVIFSAPAQRLQMFAEKLHFSNIPYFPA